MASRYWDADSRVIRVIIKNTFLLVKNYNIVGAKCLFEGSDWEFEAQDCKTNKCVSFCTNIRLCYAILCINWFGYITYLVTISFIL